MCMQLFTEDALTPISLYGKTYPVEGNVCTIPTKAGEPYLVTLVTEGLKRKDWYYKVTREKKRFIQVSRENLERALLHIIKPEEVA